VSAALSAMYVPMSVFMWRIGFLVPLAEHSASRGVCISEFAQKIKMERARERKFLVRRMQSLFHHEDR
jgi:hypothetical protein